MKMQILLHMNSPNPQERTAAAGPKKIVQVSSAGRLQAKSKSPMP